MSSNDEYDGASLSSTINETDESSTYDEESSDPEDAFPKIRTSPSPQPKNGRVKQNSQGSKSKFTSSTRGSSKNGGRKWYREVKGRKRFDCLVEGCGKNFSTSGHLARHSRIHSGLKPFTCLWDGCDQSFSRRDNMMQLSLIKFKSYSSQHYRIHVVPNNRTNAQSPPFSRITKLSARELEGLKQKSREISSEKHDTSKIDTIGSLPSTLVDVDVSKADKPLRSKGKRGLSSLASEEVYDARMNAGSILDTKNLRTNDTEESQRKKLKGSNTSSKILPLKKRIFLLQYN
ncbi:hypothetical protein HK098_000502 [Nowakowskiella sp. JEL0407]|nr:hypothetical protein HK098_000502 [Nowakowskiella sp. JEL0407]